MTVLVSPRRSQNVLYPLADGRVRMAKKRRRNRDRIKTPFSAFIWGVLVSVGINPGQLLLETALNNLEIYFQLAAIALLVVLAYYFIDDLREGVRRSRTAYRAAGPIGLAGALLSFLGGLISLTASTEAAAALAIGAALWLIATR